MNEKIKEHLIQLIVLWIIVGAAMTLPAACSKAIKQFNQQVIK